MASEQRGRTSLLNEFRITFGDDHLHCCMVHELCQFDCTFCTSESISIEFACVLHQPFIKLQTLANVGNTDVVSDRHLQFPLA